MKILAIQPYADGAGHYGKYTARLCQHIAALGHEVVLCANVDDSQRYLDQTALFTIIASIPPRPFSDFDRQGVSKLRWLAARVQNNVSALRHACMLASAERFDVVQLFSYELVSSWLLLSVLRPSGLPPMVIEIAAPVYSSEVSTHEVAFESIWRRLQRYALKRLLGRWIHAINVNSGSHVATLRCQLQLSDDFPIAVVGDTREPGENLGKAEARRRIGLEGYPHTLFLFFGTIRPDKDVSTLLAAVRLLDNSDFRVVICGMPLGTNLTTIDCGTDSRILARLEYIPEAEIDAYFYASDALVLPYKASYVGSSGPVYEACARGLPVIAADVSEMAHVVREKEIGLVVAPEDPLALSSALRTFLHTSADQRALWGANGLRMIGENDRAAIAKRYVQLYERIIL